MNKLIQRLFILLLPFYPIWAWLCFVYTNKPVGFAVTILLLPIVLYFVIYRNKKLPKYLLFFIIFTIYHLFSVYINNATIPPDVNKVYFLLTDPNILACLFFIVIEYTVFDDKFITAMNKRILLIVIISLACSLIQIKYPDFFFNTSNDEDLLYVGENRNFSIYSWTNLNSTGVTFPILISILVSVYDTRKSILPIVIISGIIVSFLTRARYVMISTIVVFSQLLLNTKRSLSKRASLTVILIAGIFFIGLVAENLGFDINEVINSRILEKDSDMASAKARVLSYEVFQIVFPEHPWFGVGPSTRQNVIDLLHGEAPVIHVGYLSYLYYYGIAGCLILFVAIYFLLKDAWDVGRKNNFWGPFYGIASLCLANLTFVYFNFSEMGIVLSVIYIRYYKYKSSLPVETEIQISKAPTITSATFIAQKSNPALND